MPFELRMLTAGVDVLAKEPVEDDAKSAIEPTRRKAASKILLRIIGIDGAQRYSLT